MAKIVEFAKFQTKPSITVPELRLASMAFQRDFLDRQPGFLRRELLQLDNDNYLDVVHWRSRADADAVMSHVATSDACAAYFALMQIGENMTEGVSHYSSLEVYELNER